MINACVSHELRNPLNSIISQNVEKQFLYQELRDNIENLKINKYQRMRLDALLDQLDRGLKVQDSSANIMSFLVQDLLDHAQIRAGKFRKNIKSFDIRETVEKVMCIQRKLANQLKIKFYAKFAKIRKSDSKQNIF